MMNPLNFYNGTFPNSHFRTVFSEVGPTCRFLNRLAANDHDGKLSDHSSCVVNGFIVYHNTLPRDRRENVDYDMSTVMQVDINMQRCLALLYIAWISGWFVSLAIKEDDEIVETPLQRMEVVCTASVFAGKALILVVDVGLFHLIPNAAWRVEFYTNPSHFLMTALDYVGDPLCMCVFGLFIFVFAEMC
jgi:hypothetical protein